MIGMLSCKGGDSAVNRINNHRQLRAITYTAEGCRMKAIYLKCLYLILGILVISALPLRNASAQLSYPSDFLGGAYYPVWSLTGIGAPWWATSVAEPTILPLQYQWPSTMIIPYAAGIGGYGITGFAGMGLATAQLPQAPLAQQGFTAMTEVPPGFGLSLGLGIGGFGGLGITRFGSPDAVSAIGIPWNWQPFFGLTSISPSYFYLGMYSPWWATPTSLQ